jgi:hypothetical protein
VNWKPIKRREYIHTYIYIHIYIDIIFSWVGDRLQRRGVLLKSPKLGIDWLVLG